MRGDPLVRVWGGEPRLVQRVAVLNRGAAARRLLHALGEHASARELDWRTVAVHPATDRLALYAREADDAVRVASLADRDALVEALTAARVDAAWGAGPTAATAAAVCDDLGIAWLGSVAATGPIGAGVDVGALAVRAGLAVATPAPGQRHLEVQVLVDQDGTAWVVGVRDASCRSGERTVLVESAWSDLPADAERAAHDAALHVVRALGLRGIATVRLVLDGAAVALDGVDPWLTERHDVTESVTGLDLARLPLGLALGDRLPADPPLPSGHAIAVAVHAEDPEAGFAPAPGRVALLRLPSGPGLRSDTGTAEGDVLPEGIDAQLVRIVAHGADRHESLVRLRRAVRDLAVVIEGGATSKGYLVGLLERPEVASGHTNDPAATAAGEPDVRALDLALVVAAADAADAALGADESAFLAYARRGRPHADHALVHGIDFVHGTVTHRLAISRTGPSAYRVRVHDHVVDAEIERVGPYESRIVVDGRRIPAISSLQGDRHVVDVDGATYRFVREEGGLVRAPGPGVVVSVPVAPGDEVAAGQTVAVIESMKLETPLPAPVAGRVRALLAGPNDQVAAGAPVVLLDVRPDLPDAAPGTVAFRAAAVPPTEAHRLRWRRAVAVLRHQLLGYDVDAAQSRQAVADLAATAAALGDDPDVAGGARSLIEVYADMLALFRGRRRQDEGEGETLRSPRQWVYAFFRTLDPDRAGLPSPFRAELARALAHHGVHDLTPSRPLVSACYRIFQSEQRRAAQRPAMIAVLDLLLASPGGEDPALRRALDRLVAVAQQPEPTVADLARDVRYHRFDEPLVRAARAAVDDEMADHLAALVSTPAGPDRDAHLDALVACPQPLVPLLLERLPAAEQAGAALVLEVMTRRYYRLRAPQGFEQVGCEDRCTVQAGYLDERSGPVHVLTTAGPFDELPELLDTLAPPAGAVPDGDTVVLDLYTWAKEARPSDDVAAEVHEALRGAGLPDAVRRVVVVIGVPGGDRRMGAVEHLTFRWTEDGFVEDDFLRGLHPLMAARLHLSRLRNFTIRRLPSADDVYAFHATARENPKDQRIFSVAEVRDLTPVRDDEGTIVALPELERMLLAALAAIRRHQSHVPPEQRLHWNRIGLHLWPDLELDGDDIDRIARRLAPATVGLGLEEIIVRFRRPGATEERALRLSSPTGTGFVIVEGPSPTEPLRPLDEYTQKVVQSRQRGATYPYELVRMLTAPRAGNRAEILGGRFVEHDLDDAGRLVPVDRAPGHNTAGIVTGVVSNLTARIPQGMQRVVLLGDPTRALGSLAEAECRRIMAALDLAEELHLPCEWFALSAGARIAMDSGTENMDWIAAVLRRIIEFTQRGHELNVVVTGINVGAQPYWNAEATMLMHTKGILVMIPDAAMVLTGKQALDYSGGVSADDNIGIGGYDRIMGPNGQAQYWAPDLTGAIGVLLGHYAHAYRVPGERFPRRASTTDPADRDIRPFPHVLAGSPFRTVGEIMSEEHNPDRKLPFDIRTVMRAVSDQDHEPLERWADMHDADTGVVWDAHVGGRPVALLGFESHNVRRTGTVGADGPDALTAGTLFPMSSRKIARAINAASGNRPLVVLANLSGFDGSPESMRDRQLEFGAEIGRAVVNFDGPIVFCVISRYHGGAFVVFSGKLHDRMEVVAVEGSRASVIGGAPAAAVVFAGDVARRTRSDPRVVELQQQIDAATGSERARLRERLDVLTAQVRSEKLGQVAAEFDGVHSVQRAQQVGSVDRIIPAHEVRPYVVEAVERGIRRELERQGLPA